MLATHTPYTESQPHARPCGGFFGEIRCLRVALGHALLPALLPVADEFAMNIEAVGVLFRHYSYFPHHFALWV
jgi:hypothetical protein